MRNTSSARGGNILMNRWKPFLQLVGFYILIVFLLCVSPHLHLGCPFKMLTGLPCPGCGGTRAFYALTKGKILEAIYTNPLSVLVTVLAVIAPIWQFIDCLRNTNSFRVMLKRKWHPAFAICVAVVIIANWIWNIYKHL